MLDYFKWTRVALTVFRNGKPVMRMDGCHNQSTLVQYLRLQNVREALKNRAK